MAEADLDAQKPPRGPSDLDASAERAEAHAVTEAAAAAAHEASQQLAALNREAARKQREADWREAELQRRHWEQLEQIQVKLEEGAQQAAKRKIDLKTYENKLQKEQKKLQAQEEAVAQAERAVETTMYQAEEKRKLAAEAMKQQKAKAAKMQADFESQKSQLEKEQAKLDVDKKKIAELKEKQTDTLWAQLAHGVDTEAAVLAFFDKRQPTMSGSVLNPWSGNVSKAPPPLKIKEMVKVVNQTRLKAFKRSGGFNINPVKAGQQHVDTLLFHGCTPEAAPNIQAMGLLLKFCGKNGLMLGKGLYGAPDPRKSKTYCGESQIGNFLFICRFNLSKAKHAGPETHHKNELFHEHCVPFENQVVVLWMLKVG